MTTAIRHQRPVKQTKVEQSPDGEWITYKNLSVFDEHTGDDGVVYDKQLLQAICDNNNRRIEDTGDWCPVVLGHTPDPGDDKEAPPILGYAGPFKVSVMGNKSPRHCIVADFHVKPERDEEFRNNPRRSVELWPEDQPEDRFIDPIAVLGAETPRRALGLVYAKTDRQGKHPIKYEMAGTVAGGSNTFIPKVAGKKRETQKHAKDEESGVDQIDLSRFQGEGLYQLWQAFKPFVDQRALEVYNGIHSNELTEDDIEEQETALEESGETPDESGDMPVDPTTEQLPQDTPGAPLPDDAYPPPEEATDFQKYMKSKLRKYMAMDADDHDKIDYAYKFMEGLDDDERDEALAVLGEPDEDDEDEKQYFSRVRYMCGGDEEKSEKHGKLPEDDPMKKGADKHSMSFKYKKLKRDHDELQSKYRKAQSENRKLRTKERYAKRHADLLNLESEGYVLDVDDEMAFCGDLEEPKYKQYLERLPLKCQKLNSQPIAHYAKERDRTPPDSKPDKYAKQAQDQCQKYRRAGKKVQYSTMLRHLIDNDGQVNEQDLFATT